MATLHVNEEQLSTQRRTQMDQIIFNYLDVQTKDYYDEEISDEYRFPVWYQLSSLRTGLLSWYPFRKNADLLEIGAGFGALTGMLCDKCMTVTATERSVHRASAIARRWGSKENLHVYAGEWSEIAFGKKFDYIVITGIMERACGGSADRNDYARYLKKVSGLLKEDGVLLLAVDNRLGLKYFCGAKESHGGKAFEGIAHYPQGTRAYSFSRSELKDIINRAGLVQMQFYYPLPDYKLPQLIYSDDFLPEQNLKERLIPYYLDHNTLVASEQELYRDVVENGTFPFFANSFLVECGRREGLRAQEISDYETVNQGENISADAGHSAKRNRVIYAAVSTDRGRERGYATAIQKNGIVRKAPLFPEGKENARRLYENISDLKQHLIPAAEHTILPDGSLELPFVPWPTLSNYMKGIIREDQEEFLSLIDRIYEYILQASETVSAGTDAELPGLQDLDCGPILKKAYMELIPLNCFYNPDTKEFLYFDQEFVRENYPAKYVLFRAIHYIYCFTPNAEQYYPKKKLIEKYGMEQTWDIYMQEEQRFLDEVRNHRKYRQFYRWAAVEQSQIRENVKHLSTEEEVIADYKISDKMKKIWKIELAMLEEVERICKEHGLTWFMVHGSLLGAVRHKGFIPWDDDIDIAMPRKDYNKFLTYARKELKEPLSLHTPETEKDIFWGGFARVRNSRTTGIELRELEHKGNLGIWIDILPLDVCTMDDKKFKEKEKLIRHCHRLILAKIYGKDYKAYGDMNAWQWKNYRMLASLYSHEKLCRMLNGAMRLYTDEDSEDVAFFSGYHKHRRLNAEDFREITMLDFENRKFPAPKGYDNYLFMTLGKDYMKYPPEEERKPKHSGIFNPDRPYTDYQRMLTHMLDGAEGKKVILFGTGLMFEDYMEKWGKKYPPEFLADNDKNRWGRKRLGIPVRPPEEILKIPEEKRRLIICSFYYKEIQKQLEQMGIRDYRVYIQRMDWILEAEERGAE